MPLPTMSKVNGQSYQHANCAPVIMSDGGRLPLSAFKSISYKDGSEKKSVQDAQGHDTGGWVVMAQKKEGSVEILMTEWVAIKRYLATAYPDTSLGLIVMNWNVSFGSTPLTQVTDKLLGVMFQDDSRESSDNQEALYVKVPLFIGGDIIDGATGKPFIQYSPI